MQRRGAEKVKLDTSECWEQRESVRESVSLAFPVNPVPDANDQVRAWSAGGQFITCLVLAIRSSSSKLAPAGNPRPICY